LALKKFIIRRSYAKTLFERFQNVEDAVSCFADPQERWQVNFEHSKCCCDQDWLIRVFHENLHRRFELFVFCHPMRVKQLRA
jgi:hypothetical protein